MNYRFNLEIFNPETEELISSEQKRTLKDIATELELDYFIVRSLYKNSTKESKALHPMMRKLIKQYKITSLFE
jgi:replicative DNA helicase